jgi:hypothetical protein
MTRSLLASTALLGSVLVGTFSQAAVNDPAPVLALPQLTISGQTSFNSWFFNNKQIVVPGDAKNTPQNRKAFGRGQLFTVDDTRIKFKVEGKTDPGMEYGMVVTLDGDVNGDHTAREAYLFFGGTWGKVYAGNTYGVQSTMSFGGWDNWGGTEFMDGNFERVINFTTGVLHSTYLVGDTNRDTKLTYLTPRWNGFQLGVSYTPRSEHRGEQSINSITSYLGSKKKPFDTDNISSGVNFIHEFCNGFEVALSATSIFAKSHPEYLTKSLKRKNIASFALGGSFSYADIGFSIEYGNNGNSREPAGQSFSNAGQFLDLGLSYTWGATKFSTGYYYGWRNAWGAVNPAFDAANPAASPVLTSPSLRQKSTMNAVSAAVDHKLAPGLGVYFEYAHFQMKNPAATAEANRLNAQLASSGQFAAPVKSNSANAFIVGSRLVF